MNREMRAQVNRVGRIGRIICTVMLIITLVGVACLGIGTAASFAVPNGSINITLSGTAAIRMNEAIATRFKERGDPFGMSSGNMVPIVIDSSTYEPASIEETPEGGILITAPAAERKLEIYRVRPLLIIGAFYLLTGAVVLVELRKLMDEFSRCETPFTEGIIYRLNRLLIMFLCLFGASCVADSAARSFISGRLAIRLNLNMVAVVGVLALVLLIRVFRYGAELQRESDETL